MKLSRFILPLTLITLCAHYAFATQAEDTTITITAQNAGVTPFITQLTLAASDTTVLKSIQFTITPKPGSVTRPLSGTYSNSYLVSRGYLQPTTGEIFLPVYGLYDNYTNTVTLTYRFSDHSSNTATVSITTTAFADPCGYETPTVLQARSKTTSLSYDYFLVKARCSAFSPAIIDSDGRLRWVGPVGIADLTTGFFDNAIYQANGTNLVRLELDGVKTVLHDYSDIGVTELHHNIDRGKTGLIIDVTTTSYVESTNFEVDAAGNILKTWDLAAIISAAMIAGGDDPSQFVFRAPVDWFHNNGVAYNRADDSLVISSRENFVICIDYETGAIKWILGDPTKKWHQFPSLARYALTLAPGSLPPIGQHSPSITYDQKIMVFDNGFLSEVQSPPGETRTYASPRIYQIDLNTFTATEVWNYERNQSIRSPLCGSVYEDAAHNYLIDYALVGGFIAESNFAQLLGLDATGAIAFLYQYPTVSCNRAYNSSPLHLESTSFPTVGPQALNLSTRGTVSGGDHALIGGFIVTGSEPKKVALRVLGPSLGAYGVTGFLSDPVLTLYNSTGTVITMNDDWQNSSNADELVNAGIAPNDPSEAATVRVLAPGTYTVVAAGKGSDSGISLVEAYDLATEADSRLANISTRGSAGVGDDVLISGFIVGDVASATTIIRALGPSLAAAQVSDPLSDPTLTIYDVNGTVIASNDNWQDDPSEVDLQRIGLAPTNAAESATILNLPAGSYSAIVRGAGDTTGIALVEVYDLESPENGATPQAVTAR